MMWVMRGACESPLYIFLMAENLFSAFEPGRHLREFVLVVCGAIRIFSKVDVEAFGVLGVVIICGTIQSNHVSIVKREMEFWQVERVPNAEVDENVLVVVEEIECLVQKNQCL